MRDRNHMVFDIETLAKSANAVVLSIGAAILRPDGSMTSTRWVIKRQPQVALGRVIDPDTVSWWMSQDEEARKISFPGEEREMDYVDGALDQIMDQWREHQCSMAWGYGAAFDLAILESLYRDMDMGVPWTYKQQGCLRTISSLYPEVPREKPFCPHDPLSDAIAQALWLRSLMDRAYARD